MIYETKPVRVTATQWFKLGDSEFVTAPLEGGYPENICHVCNKPYGKHGRMVWDTGSGYKSGSVCPGDWIVVHPDNVVNVVSSAKFKEYYVKAEEDSGAMTSALDNSTQKEFNMNYKLVSRLVASPSMYCVYSLTTDEQTERLVQTALKVPSCILVLAPAVTFRVVRSNAQMDLMQEPDPTIFLYGLFELFLLEEEEAEDGAFTPEDLDGVVTFDKLVGLLPGVEQVSYDDFVKKYGIAFT